MKKVNVSLLGRTVGVLALWRVMGSGIRLLFIRKWEALTPPASLSSIEKLQMYAQKTMYMQFYYILLFVGSLCLYYLVLWDEKDSSYPPLLTKQPVVMPFIKGFFWGAILVTSCVGIGLFSGGIVMHESQDVLLFSDILWLFYNSSFLILNFCFFQFFRQFGQELFRGYALTRLERVFGGVAKIWLFGIFPLAVYMLASVIYPGYGLALHGLIWLLLFVLCNYLYVLVRSIYFTTGLQLGFLGMQYFIGQKYWYSINQQYYGIQVGMLLIAIGVAHYLLVKKESVKVAHA